MEWTKEKKEEMKDIDSSSDTVPVWVISDSTWEKSQTRKKGSFVLSKAGTHSPAFYFAANFSNS